MENEVKVISLENLEKTLTEKKVGYTRSGKLIEGSKRHTTEGGFKLKVKFSIEEVTENDFIGSVIGLRGDFFTTDPLKVISEFESRLPLLRG